MQAVSTSREQALDLDFAGVLSLVQGWLAAELLLVVESGHPPCVITAFRGFLGAAADITDPSDPDEFGFALDGHDFSLHRRHFASAVHYPLAAHLEVRFDNRSRVGLAATMHILRQIG